MPNGAQPVLSVNSNALISYGFPIVGIQLPAEAREALDRAFFWKWSEMRLMILSSKHNSLIVLTNRSAKALRFGVNTGSRMDTTLAFCRISRNCAVKSVALSIGSASSPIRILVANATGTGNFRRTLKPVENSCL